MDYHIHTSDIQTFLKCRRAWNWNSSLRLNLEPALPVIPFYIGRAVHYCIEEKGIRGTPFKQSLQQYVENERAQMEALDVDVIIGVEENLPKVAAILDHYDLVWNDPRVEWGDHDLEFIDVEVSFDVPLMNIGPHRVFFSGRFDGLVQRKSDKSFWIFETKTTRSIDEFVLGVGNNLQVMGYLWAARELNYLPIKGMLFNMIKKSAPIQPKIGVKGMLSQAKNQAVTYHSYLQSIKDLHSDFEDSHIEMFYGDFLYWLRDKPNDFFARYTVTRQNSDIDRTMEWVKLVAADMLNIDLPLYPSPSWFACNFCAFKNPCMLVERGIDPASVLAVDYRHKVLAHSLRQSKEIEDAETES